MFFAHEVVFNHHIDFLDRKPCNCPVQLSGSGCNGRPRPSKKGDYQKAINFYFAVEAFEPDKSIEIKEKVNLVF